MNRQSHSDYRDNDNDANNNYRERFFSFVPETGIDDQTTNTHVGTVPTIQTPTKDEVSENRGIWGKGNIRRYLMAILCGIPFVLAVTYRQNQLVLNTSWDKEAIRWANYLGDWSFALTGSLTAGNTGMDLLGCIIVGFITALGGGTIRDVLLGRLPVFWLAASDEFILCIATSTLTFFCWPYVSRRFRLSVDDEWVFWTDAVGVGVFGAAGAHTGDQAGIYFAGCALCGMSTATFGGMTRDILCQRPPRILYSTCEIYAPCGYIAGCAYMAIVRYWNSEMQLEAIMFGTWVGIIMRVIAYNHFIILPTFDGELPPQQPLPAPYLGTREAPLRERSETVKYRRLRASFLSEQSGGTGAASRSIDPVPWTGSFCEDEQVKAESRMHSRSLDNPPISFRQSRAIEARSATPNDQTKYDAVR